MKKINYKPKGVCCREIVFELNDENVITNINFIGGCPGNLIGLKSLVIGQNANDISTKLKDIPCGAKKTSCPDQLAIAIQENLH
ncbi:MAG: TIGR03905 family TSCPD domain-containing protein [Peptostreptococcaceae bacterium]